MNHTIPHTQLTGFSRHNHRSVIYISFQSKIESGRTVCTEYSFDVIAGLPLQAQITAGLLALLLVLQRIKSRTTSGFTWSSKQVYDDYASSL